MSKANANMERVALLQGVLLTCYDMRTEGAQTALTDLLANVYHFCDAHTLNFADVQKAAYRHYCVERDADGSQWGNAPVHDNQSVKAAKLAMLNSNRRMKAALLHVQESLREQLRSAPTTEEEELINEDLNVVDAALNDEEVL